MSKFATAKAATTVRYGPSSSIYASVGSIDANETVIVHGKENGWYCISYNAGSLLKRGFVPAGSFTDESDLTTDAIITSGSSKTLKTAQTVYTGPIPENYATAGSVSAGEVVTAFGPVSDDYTYIEYGTGSGVKRGYVPTSQLTNTKGKLAVMTGGATVYYGPSTAHAVSGSIDAGEYCVIISREMPFGTSAKWCQIEYISGSSRKRGYIKQGNIVPFGSLATLTNVKTVYGNAMMLADRTVYTGPSSSFVAAGSVSLNEVIQTLGKSQESTSYTYIEYSTGSGKKRGYVTAGSVSEEILFPHTMAQAATVYGGPSETIYASIGSVSADEAVEVIAKEDNWFEINYIGLTQYKRGFVPASSLQNAATIAAGLSESTYTGHMDLTTKELSVYSGPADTYATVGSLAANEAVTVISGASNGFSHIEYSTPSGTKRGYIPLTSLAHKTRGILGKVKQNTSAYFGASTGFLKSGGVFANEYVVVLDRETSSKYSTLWYYIEFNAASGRKRGYVNQNDVTLSSTGASLGGLKTGDYLGIAKTDLTVYNGPSEAYATVGTISASERVSVYEGRSQESDYAFIEYCTPSGSKMGYVPVTQLLKTSFGIPIPNTTIAPTVYGTSGTGKHSLKYYRIGAGPNALMAVFAVHGYEDAWAADGLELCKLANQLIETLGAETSADWRSNWSVYIVPAANPDGITDGYTHNGPGRTTVSTGVDFNRCFPTNFVSTYDARNYTGSQSLLAPEAKALYNTIKQIKSSSTTMRLLDIHGWLNTTYGDSNLSAPFCTQFGFGNQSVMGGKGYLSRWAISAGIPAALIELPFPYAISDIADRQYFAKLNAAIHSIFELEVDVPDDEALYSRGDTGEEVGVLQAYLKYNGYFTANITEYYGDATQDAVRNYQRTHSIAMTGWVDGETLTTMGFCTGSTGSIHDNNEMYTKFLNVSKFYVAYQESRDSVDKYRIYTGENYIRFIYGDKQLAFTMFGGKPIISIENLSGGDSQIYILTATHNGYKISPKGFSDYALSVNLSTFSVSLEKDTGANRQRWAIDTNGDTCCLTNVECLGRYLYANVTSDSLVMRTEKYYWSCRKVIDSRRLTDEMREIGVTIVYKKNTGRETDVDKAKEEYPGAYKVKDYWEYANYYLDYTVPLEALFVSIQQTCFDNAAPPLDAAIGPEGGGMEAMGVVWLERMANSFLTFYDLVDHGGPWDIKRQEVWERTLKDLPFIEPDPTKENGNKFIFRGNFRTGEDMGNFMYGYAGTLFGFGDEILFWAGGAAALSEGGGMPGFIMALPSDAALEQPFHGDDSWDHYAIQEGIDLAKEYYPNLEPTISPLVAEIMEAIIKGFKSLAEPLG